VLNVALPERPAEPLPPMPVQPTLLLPETAPRHPSAARQVATARQPRETVSAASSAEPQRLAGDAARQAMQQLSRELFYPPEAVERGLEGEALVLLFLDASGNAIAARLESSSGHALLDDAAVKAARAVRALPGTAPREALLPVRFRLR
jgi:protein TonB